MNGTVASTRTVLASSVAWRASGYVAPPFTPCASPNGHVYDISRPTDAAAYDIRDGARVVWFLGKWWMFGGWSTSMPWGQITTNEVWSSTDLATWTLELAHDATPPTSGAGARWRPRHTFGAVVMGGYVWVLGTDQYDSEGWLSDVWRSADMITWERVAASSPWGPAQIPIVVACNGRIHVLGGYKDPGEDIFASASSAQHWSSADGVTWTQHPDMPFTRGATDAVVQCGLLIVFGGSQGNPYSARTFPTDTWAWNGSTWQQMSISSGGVWQGRDWAATATYDGKLWLLTGVYEDHVNPSQNLGDAQWSEDLGVTWTKIYAPWNPTHAGAAAVNENGLAHLCGFNQGLRTWMLSSEANTGPHLATLTGWWRAQYRSDAIVGVASAGTSGSRTLSVLTGKALPGSGTRLNGREVEVYSAGTALTDTEVFLDSYVTASSWWVGVLVYVDSASAAAGAAYDDPAIVSDENGGWVLAVTSSGVRAVNYDGAAYRTTPHAALGTGAWAWVEAWLSGGTLSVAVNGGTPQTVASGNLTAVSARSLRCGVNYDGTRHFVGKVAERMIATARPSSMLNYLNARHGLSL